MVVGPSTTLPPFSPRKITSVPRLGRFDVRAVGIPETRQARTMPPQDRAPEDPWTTAAREKFARYAAPAPARAVNPATDTDPVFTVSPRANTSIPAKRPHREASGAYTEMAATDPCARTTSSAASPRPIVRSCDASKRKLVQRLTRLLLSAYRDCKKQWVPLKPRSLSSSRCSQRLTHRPQISKRREPPPVRESPEEKTTQ